MSLCSSAVRGANCLLQSGHRGAHNPMPAVWYSIANDPEEKTRKKIVKAGFATPRGGDKGGYQNHVSRSSRVIIPFEHAPKVNFQNYKQGSVVRITVPQAISLLASGELTEENDYLVVNINGIKQRAFVLYRATGDLQALPIPASWQACGHRINGIVSTRRRHDGQDFGHYLNRIPRGKKAGIQQGIFAPEYSEKDENYACQVLLTYLAYQTQGAVADPNLGHTIEILQALNVFNPPLWLQKGSINSSGTTACPLCMRPIAFEELHEAIDPSQVPGLANSGVQLAETRSTLVNLFHLEPLLYSTTLGHTKLNVAWGHAHCNTFLAQRKVFSLLELNLASRAVSTQMFWDESEMFIRAEDGRVWVSVTPVEPGIETFTDYLSALGFDGAIATDDSDEEEDD